MNSFKSSYSKEMLAATIALIILIAGATYSILTHLVTMPVASGGFIFFAVTAVIIVLGAVYAYAEQIESVALTPDFVIINKKLGHTLIARDEIVRIRRKESMAADLRVCGISGLFGHIGYFRHRTRGIYRAYVKDGDSMIEISTHSKIYVVSCDDCMQVVDLLSR